MNLHAVCPVYVLLGVLLVLGETGRADEPASWTARPDPSSHPIDWSPKADLAIDLRPLGGSIVHPPTLTPYVLVNGTWLHQESPVYDLRTGEIAGRVGAATERAGAGMSCALSPDGKWVAMTRNSQSPSVWSTESGEKTLQLNAPGDQQIQFADDRRLITFHGQWGVKVWSIPEGKLLVEFDLPRSAHKRAMDTTPGGNYLLVVAKNNDSRPPQVVAIDLRTGTTAGAVSVPARSPFYFHGFDASFDGTEFGCVWASRDGAFLTAWRMEDGRRTVQHRLGDSWKEFAERFDQGSLSRGRWDASHLCWKPDGSGWLVAAAIHVDRETGDASPILLPEPCFCSEVMWTPRHLPGNQVLNVLRERPAGLLAVVKYDPEGFPEQRQEMKAGYLPADFGRPKLSKLPSSHELPLRQLPELAEAVPAYVPSGIAIAENALPDRVEVQYPTKNSIFDMWQPEECQGDLFLSYGPQSKADSVFWYLAQYAIRSQEETRRFTPAFLTRPVDVSPSGRTVLTRTEDGRFDLWRFSGEHLLGFRPQWPVDGWFSSIRDLPVALVDDERFLQLGDSRELVLRTLPDGKGVYRVATETGRYDLPSFDRRSVLLFRTFGWDVLNVDTGAIAQRITLSENVRGLHHHAVFSPSGKQVALILPIELPERTNKNPDAVQGRLSRSLSVIDLVSQQETMRLSLPQRYEASPLWVSEDYLLIDSPFDEASGPELPTYSHQHLLIHAATGWPVWRFLTRDYLQLVRHDDRLRGVWSDLSERPRGVLSAGMAASQIPRLGRLLGQSLLTSEIVKDAEEQLAKNRRLLDRFTHLAVDVALDIPTELDPPQALVYRHDRSLVGFTVSSESIRCHFRRLVEEQGIEVDPNAEHRLRVSFVEKPLEKTVERILLAGLRDASSVYFTSDARLDKRLEKEGPEIRAVQVTCAITISNADGNELASVERSFDTFDSGLRDSLVRDDESIRDRLRKNVWQAAITWCLNQSAQSILTGTFDERQIPTTRLDGGKLEELSENRLPLGPPQ